MKARAFETERDLKRAQDTITVSKSCEKTLTGKISFFTVEVSSVRVERANLCVDLDVMSA